MKKLLIILSLFLCFGVLAGCSKELDLSSIEQRISELENHIMELETDIINYENM